MYINRIHVDQVALARSLAASVTVRRAFCAQQLPHGRRYRKPPNGGGNRLLLLMRRLLRRPTITRVINETAIGTHRREYVRRRVLIEQMFRQRR
jgi:hypothetical protein